MWPRGGICTALVLIAVLVGACSGGDRCRLGQTRACTLAYEGGVSQSGTQSCRADGYYSECVGEGVCRSATGAVRAAYARCSTDDACGPTGCATCSAYGGVTNAEGVQGCHPFCTTDLECATDSAASGVSARCELGQCLLLCRASGTCPLDSQCLPWNDTSLAVRYAPYEGLCD